jgi:hypothetical protein
MQRNIGKCNKKLVDIDPRGGEGKENNGFPRGRISGFPGKI